MQRRHSKNYNFIGDANSGFSVRWGEKIGENPVLSPWPELADISISNHCTKGCSFCYRNSTANNSFISLEDYEYILKSLLHPKWGNVFQVAIGGGEPLEHPDFINIIKTTKDKFNVIPNFTTNGLHLNAQIARSIKEYVGAVAISAYYPEDLVEPNFRYLIENNIKTNLHFVISSENIDTAIKILRGEYNSSLINVNAVIFLLFKPYGRGQKSICVEKNKYLIEFLSLVDNNRCSTKIGFDACSVPLLLHYTNINPNLIESCEAGFFSVYIDEALNVKPCSFTNNPNDIFSLKENMFSDIWTKLLNNYRRRTSSSCNSVCKRKMYCQRVCPYFNEINLCYS